MSIVKDCYYLVNNKCSPSRGDCNNCELSKYKADDYKKKKPYFKMKGDECSYMGSLYEKDVVYINYVKSDDKSAQITNTLNDDLCDLEDLVEYNSTSDTNVELKLVKDVKQLVNDTEDTIDDEEEVIELQANCYFYHNECCKNHRSFCRTCPMTAILKNEFDKNNRPKFTFRTMDCTYEGNISSDEIVNISNIKEYSAEISDGMSDDCVDLEDLLLLKED